MKTALMSRNALKALLFLAITSCSAERPTAAFDEAEAEGAFSSVRATQLDFTMSLSLESSGTVWNPRALIDSQMLYTMGHLNGNDSVARLDKVVISDMTTETLANGNTKISYKVKVPVAWGSKTNLPASYNFVLPKMADYTGLQAFTAKYAATCIEFGAHDVTSGSYWYYYRVGRSGCTFDDADVIRVTATATVSTENTTGKYPEYTKVWEDGTLNVMAVFGKYEAGATSDFDAGIAAYNEFVRTVAARFAAFGLVTVPAALPANAGVANPDVTFTATLPGGRKLVITALLVDGIRNTTPAFDARYEALSSRADLIAYNGHAGLGANVRALATKGNWVTGQYVVFVMNGCDTFAYVDGSLAQLRARVNPDDVTGTKYMEIVTNAMPSFFHQDSETTMAFVNGLIAVEAPMSYDQIFADIDPSQVVVVTGEEDNVFHPGGDPAPWAGMKETAVLKKNEVKRFVTPVLAAGKYTFSTTGTGDTGLFIRAGLAPTTRTYDCGANVRGSSNETCTLTLTTAAAVHVMLRGYSAAVSTVELVGAATR